ncbi:snRNA-activating protein complex subunit 3 isoform X1 [Zophobas morio]|uniref:snRNA-activating protein complex subunit 3 isoform X1 n=1 Tax=Zophobas morio TaxID=2755281 RepID=UPI003082B2FF
MERRCGSHKLESAFFASVYKNNLQGDLSCLEKLNSCTPHAFSAEEYFQWSRWVAYNNSLIVNEHNEESVSEVSAERLEKDELILTVDVFSLAGNKLPVIVVVFELSRYFWRRFSQRFEVYGTQNLKRLKDFIYCVNNLNEGALTVNSEFFYIENTFYIDFGVDSENSLCYQDYSKDILAWAEQVRHPDFHKMKTWKAPMHFVTFLELSIRLGCPYLYQHQGDCQHILKFSKVRLLHETDSIWKSSYPLNIIKEKLSMRKCSICLKFPASKVVYNDEKALENPMFYCKYCFGPLQAGDERANHTTPAPSYIAYSYFHD